MGDEIPIIPDDLEVHAVGDNGDMEILPATDELLSTSRLPCGLPPILPDTNAILASYLDDIEKLPIFDLDAVQRIGPGELNVRNLFDLQLSSLQTELAVKRDKRTGKLLGFVEQVKSGKGTSKTSTSLSRAPGKPQFGVLGSTSSFPFWPGGMEEPFIDILSKEPPNVSLFDGEHLDTPPGFKCGMKFERKTTEKIESIPKMDKISLNDILSMDDFEDFCPENDAGNNEEYTEETEVANKDAAQHDPAIDSFKIEDLPILNISEAMPQGLSVSYKWAVVEDVRKPVEDFDKKIPDMAYKWDFELDTFQKRAILHLEKHENVFVAAHTSAGKTVVAEYAIALSKKHLTRVLYTSPIKALSNQKFRDFKKQFKDVGLITGDVKINDTAFCLIMTTEILRSMLYHGSDVVRDVEWVIFDEVHYINDAERGVVWEEVFIMLPKHINLIMLSATVPNTAEFAEWLGNIKKRNVYVISTYKRPVPLVHHLYTGSVGQSQDDIFPIINSEGQFSNAMYMKAVNSKKNKDSTSNKKEKDKGKQDKGKPATGPKGPRQIVSLAQEKNIYIGLLAHLQKNKLLPVICFTLSRKRCNERTYNLTSQDFTTKEEKGKIRGFFKNSIAKLNDNDKNLLQVTLMESHLTRGFGIHHSGILPILKEVVEMLFQEGLVKVLFATETFAMGVNMPAKSVVFDSIRKHDGKEFRTLVPSEYIQMAGRAGRRGLDDTGTVIILCKMDVMDEHTLLHMMKGQPTKLESQFKLTYSMILNLLKVRTLRVEDVMKRSFGESEHEKQREQCTDDKVNAQERLSQLHKPTCSICLVDLEQYCKTLAEMNSQRLKIMEEVCSANLKVLSTGRVITFSTSDHHNIPAIVLSTERDNKCSVLTFSLNPTNDSEMKPWSKALMIPANGTPVVSTIPFSDILFISNKTIKISSNDIQRDWKKMSNMRSRPAESLEEALRELTNFSQANKKGLPEVNLTFRVMNLTENVLHLRNLQSSMQSFTCIKCPMFSNHCSSFSEILHLQEEIKKLEYKLSEESLQLHPEYENRKEVLRELRYIDVNDVVQLKGSVAREMSNHELVITEILVRGIFADSSPEDIAALLSCMVFQQKCQQSLADIGIPLRLLNKIKEMKTVIEEIDRKQRSLGVIDPQFTEQYNFHLTNVVHEWTQQITFAQIMENSMVEVEEGIVVRCIQRLSELLKDVRSASNLVGETVLAKKVEEASRLIKRDIVFAASLYTQ